MIATLETPTAGSATVCGHDVVTEGDAVRRKLSLTGQFAALEDNLTAAENLLLMTRLRGYDRATAAKVVDRLIDRFDIGEFRGKLVKQVSGGQRRRIDLAASLVTRPELLVLDEPTTGLDPRSRQVVWSSIRDLVAEGVTLLLTTQYLEEADVLADSIVLIDHGRAVAAGTPSQLKSQIGDQRVDVVAVDGPGLERLVIELQQQFRVTVSREQRSVSIPAPDEAADLARVPPRSVRAAASPSTRSRCAARRSTTRFLALTGRPASEDSTGERPRPRPGVAA